MTIATFHCVRCNANWPEQFLAYTYTHSRLCRWCQEETANIPQIVYEPDLKALTIAQLASRAMFGRQPLLFKAEWWCC